MQYDSLRTPVSGEPLSKTIHSADWLRRLVNAATRRNYNTVEQPEQERGIELLTPLVSASKVAVTAGSLIGAVAATYPTSPTSEPFAYMQGTVQRGNLLLYTKQDTPTDVDRIVAYPFRPGVPVRIRISADAATDYYAEGISIGRPIGQTVGTAGYPGLILVSKPYTPDSTNYYAWVVLDPWPTRRAIIIDSLAAPTDGTPTTCVAAGVDYDPDTHEMTPNDLRYTVYNYDQSLTAQDGSYAKIEACEGLWEPYWVSCNPLGTGFTGLAADPGA